jgi:hypothetical protein
MASVLAKQASPGSAIGHRIADAGDSMRWRSNVTALHKTWRVLPVATNQLYSSPGCQMVLNVISEFILQPLFEIIVQVSGYLTGSVMLPLLSAGMCRMERATWTTRFRHLRKSAHIALQRPRIISADTSVFFGFLFWIVVVVLTVFVRHALDI